MNSQQLNDAAIALSREIERFLKLTGSRAVGQARTGQGPLQGLFEDTLTVVGYAVYETVGELLNSWIDSQDQMAKAISRSNFDLGAKAWDGYLVLATPEQTSPDQSADVAAIRSNTRRLRKLLVLGEDVQPIGSRSLVTGVARCLAPLAPLDLSFGSGTVDPLSNLGSRLSVPGLSIDQVNAVVDAYRNGRPLIQALHDRTNAGGDL